jgi:hypothetical protein
VEEAVKAVPVVLAETVVPVALAVAESIHQVQTMDLEVQQLLVQDGLTVLVTPCVELWVEDSVK